MCLGIILELGVSVWFLWGFCWSAMSMRSGQENEETTGHQAADSGCTAAIPCGEVTVQEVSGLLRL